MGAGFLKTVRVDKNAIFPVFRAPNGNKIPAAQRTDFPYSDFAIFKHGHAVHPAFAGQHPGAANFEVFRIDAHRVEPFRGNLICWGRHPNGFRRIHKLFFGKIWRRISAQRKTHQNSPCFGKIIFFAD